MCHKENSLSKGSPRSPRFHVLALEPCKNDETNPTVVQAVFELMSKPRKCVKSLPEGLSLFQWTCFRPLIKSPLRFWSEDGWTSPDTLQAAHAVRNHKQKCPEYNGQSIIQYWTEQLLCPSHAAPCKYGGRSIGRTPPLVGRSTGWPWCPSTLPGRKRGASRRSWSTIRRRRSF
jgi:hypothetical protein